jgi:cell wall-associated NlpC family hydrolase
MHLFRHTIKLLFILLVVLSFASCSSSSTSKRYNRNDDEEESTSTESVRFSSDDDETTYNNRAYSREFDEEPVEEYPVDKDSFIDKYKNSGRFTGAATAEDKMMSEIVKFLDTPYLYGGESTDGIDCSSFTQQVFNNALQLKLPRTASQQYQVGSSIKQGRLKFGDLVFFNTQRNSYPGHVGIFVGDDLFAHASISQGVTISSLKNSYYQNRFIGGKRVD